METQVSSNIANFKDSMLLHDTLKCLAVQESVKEASNVTINKFICVTIILTNILSCSISILGTIVIYTHINPTPNINNHHQTHRLNEGLPGQLHLDNHEVRDKRDHHQPLTLDQFQPVTLSHPQPVDETVTLGHPQPVDDQHLPEDRGHPVPLDWPHPEDDYLHANSHYQVNIRVTKNNDSIADEEDDLQDFWTS